MEIMMIFFAAVAIELVYIALFVMTIRMPGFRFWPPPGARSWQFFTAWILALLAAVAFLILGLADFDSFLLPPFWERLPFALAIIIPASLFGSWASLSFNLRTTLGLGDRLFTGGPYRLTRNPQYICDSLNILGCIVLANSWMALVLGALAIALNALAPFTEEPWLEERFGESYREYKRRTPRFFRISRARTQATQPGSH